MSGTVARAHRPLEGIAFCVMALFAFAVQDSIVKSLSSDYAVLQILGLRSLVLFVILLPLGRYLHGPGVLKASQPRLMLIRGVFGFLAFATYYLALSQIPLAEAASVYMTAPLFVTALSVPLLGERVGWHRWAAVILGFVAVLVMLNPGSALFRVEAAMPMFSAICYAMIPIITRRIGLSEHAITMALYTTVSFVVLCLLVSLVIHLLPPGEGTGFTENLLRRWRWLDAGAWVLVVASGVAFTIGLLSITHAYRVSVVSAVAPFEYSYLIWATLIGFLVFGDVPGLRTVLGASAVVACGCYVMYREQRSAARHWKPES